MLTGPLGSQGLNSDRVSPILVRDVEEANTLLVLGGRKSHPKAQISLTMVTFRTRHCPIPLPG